MKSIFAPVLLATVLAGTSVGAFALTYADQYGEAVSAQFVQRTIVINEKTRSVMVKQGETVTIQNGDASVTWTFDGIRGAFDLSKIMPATANGKAVTIYVAMESLG